MGYKGHSNFPPDDELSLHQGSPSEANLEIYYNNQFVENQVIHHFNYENEEGTMDNFFEYYFTHVVIPGTITGTLFVNDEAVQTFVEDDVTRRLHFTDIGTNKVVATSGAVFDDYSGSVIDVQLSERVDPTVVATKVVVSYEYNPENEQAADKQLALPFVDDEEDWLEELSQMGEDDSAGAGQMPMADESSYSEVLDRIDDLEYSLDNKMEILWQALEGMQVSLTATMKRLFKSKEDRAAEKDEMRSQLLYGRSAAEMQDQIDANALADALHNETKQSLARAKMAVDEDVKYFQKAYKRAEMMEDAAIIHHLTRDGQTCGSASKDHPKMSKEGQWVKYKTKGAINSMSDRDLEDFVAPLRPKTAPSRENLYQILKKRSEELKQSDEQS